MFATWLREVRAKSGLTQDAIAAKARELDPECRVFQTRISEWERAQGIPSLRQFVALCSALDLPDVARAAGKGAWERAQVAA